jgi:hypothetical protein
VHVTKYARQNDGLNKLTDKGLSTMNRETYQATRRSIRDNGIRYTLQHAIDTDNTDAMFTCDDIANVMRETDWLSMRVNMQRSETKAVAFKLTTTIL